MARILTALMALLTALGLGLWVVLPHAEQTPLFAQVHEDAPRVSTVVQWWDYAYRRGTWDALRQNIAPLLGQTAADADPRWQYAEAVMGKMAATEALLEEIQKREPSVAAAHQQELITSPSAVSMPLLLQWVVESAPQDPNAQARVLLSAAGVHLQSGNTPAAELLISGAWQLLGTTPLEAETLTLLTQTITRYGYALPESLLLRWAEGMAALVEEQRSLHSTLASQLLRVSQVLTAEPERLPPAMRLSLQRAFTALDFKKIPLTEVEKKVLSQLQAVGFVGIEYATATEVKEAKKTQKVIDQIREQLLPETPTSHEKFADSEALKSYLIEEGMRSTGAEESVLLPSEDSWTLSALRIASWPVTLQYAPATERITDLRVGSDIRYQNLKVENIGTVVRFLERADSTTQATEPLLEAAPVASSITRSRDLLSQMENKLVEDILTQSGVSFPRGGIARVPGTQQWVLSDVRLYDIYGFSATYDSQNDSFSAITLTSGKTVKRLPPTPRTALEAAVATALEKNSRE